MPEPNKRAEFMLANGERLTVELVEEGSVGTSDFRLRVYGERDVLVLPRSGNSLELTTSRALAEETRQVAINVDERDRAKAGK